MNIFIKIFNKFYEVYIVIISVLFFLFLKPFIYFFRDYKFSFYILSFINHFYFLEKFKQKKSKKMYDLRLYRDTYDKNGYELYFLKYDSINLIKNKIILDFGCGVGRKSYELLKFKPKKIVGIDLSERNISYANELINKNNKKILSYHNKNIFSINEKFDTILSFTVFEHVNKNDLKPILNKMYELLNRNGKIIIVFNHYNAKYGLHLNHYIFHPWPQTLFEENFLFKYWNFRLKKDNNVNKNSYFPLDYDFSNNKKTDCFMSLNKVSIHEFEKIIKETKFKYNGKDLYSKSFLLKLLPFLPRKYLLGNAIYYLSKNE
jgi:2-polyprenyl-3-methyl-5-hydroxy-6-metoxy-1,4-benzoquinol methylase